VIGRAEGLVLSRIQYQRFRDVLAGLSPDEWAAPVADCPGWSVKDVAGHVLGGLECVAKPKEFVRQAREGRRLDPHVTQGLNAYQVVYYGALSPAEVLSRIDGTVDRALRGRARTPWLLRHLVRPKLDVMGRTPMAFVLDTIYTRDTFIHRIDLCRATGREVLADEVEARIVEDMAGEWLARHGQPVTLVVDGATYGAGGERIETTAVEFARNVSGRGDPEGLLKTPVQV
jgi:uncharacterized protein (TIGR03083 family)